MTWQDDFYKLIVTGEIPSITNSEHKITEALKLLKQGIAEDPSFVIETLTQSYQQGSTGMLPLTISLILTVTSLNSILIPKVQELLFQLDAKTLCELTSLLKNKIFGMGLGSKIQKLIRQVMESWTAEDLSFYITTQSKYLYSLLKLIHPRYDSDRGRIIRLWLYENL